jgi:predicted transcriptional regulator
MNKNKKRGLNVKNNVKRARVLDLISSSEKQVNISTISLVMKVSQTAIYRLLKRMKSSGLLTSDNQLTEQGFNHVKKWNAISADVKFNIKPNDIRLANVQVKVRILNKPSGYDYRKNNLISMKVRDYKIFDLKHHYKEKFIINNVQVFTNPNSIEIFPEDIYARTKQQAVKRLMDIVFDVTSRIENLHKIILIKDNYCNIIVSKQHYSLIENQLAKIYRTEKKHNKFRIFDEKDGKVR